MLQKKAFRAIKNSFNIFYIVLSYACLIYHHLQRSNVEWL